MLTLGFILALIVGISLGLIGSGGSILTVPILVYILGIDPIIATGYSLFIVGSTALAGGIRQYYQKQVHFKTVLLFGIPSVIVVLLVRSLLIPALPDVLFRIGSIEVTKATAILVLFAIVMLRASYAMIKPCPDCQENIDLNSISYPVSTLITQGSLVGLLSGLVGAGGGFLIIPVLVLRLKMPMKMAVGSSLFIIAINALIGFLGDFKHFPVFDWGFLFSFSAIAILGILIGIFLSTRINGARLKSGLGWFVLAMGIYILIRELLFK